MIARLSSPRIVLAAVCAVAAALLAAGVPVLDEESYLSIAAGLDPLRPYDWWRPWPPWNGGHEADAFVYAHPPLFLWWVAGWAKLAGTSPDLVRAIKVAAALPWAALLGWSVGRLAERLTRHPWLAVLSWVSVPVVVLGLQRGLMPDLAMTAALSFAMAAWLEGLACPPGRWWKGARARWLVMGGVALACAAWTKYPAAVVVPVLLLHGRARGELRNTWPFWLAAGVLWGGGEAWLWASYGRLHLWEVVSRAGELPRGPFLGRLLGVAVRLSLAAVVLPLAVRGWRRAWLPAAGLAAVLVALGAPEGTPGLHLFALGALGTLGLVGLAPTLKVRGEADHGLITGWALAWLAVAVFGHNFAAPRYLLPLTVPLALLVVQGVEAHRGGRTLLAVGTLLSLLGSLALTESEHRFADACSIVARSASSTHPEGGGFTGEWTFRWRMEQAGWQFFTGQAAPGDLVMVPANSSPGAIPTGWEEVERFESPGTWPLRVQCAACGIGLYGETTGALPFGWSHMTMEEAVTWRVR